MKVTDQVMVAAIDTNLIAAVPYGVLEPGLKAALDLLERERRNEVSMSGVLDAEDETAAAHYHAHNAKAYQLAQELLKEQMERLKQGVSA